MSLFLLFALLTVFFVILLICKRSIIAGVLVVLSMVAALVFQSRHMDDEIELKEKEKAIVLEAMHTQQKDFTQNPYTEMDTEVNKNKIIVRSEVKIVDAKSKEF